MTPEQYRRAQELAERAEPLDDRSRQVLLDEVRGADPEVADLLAEWLAEAPPEDFLEQSRGFEPVSGLLDQAPLENLEGVVLGRYRLAEPLGEGGFGVVHRATQTEPVEREVAVKVIKLGMDTRRVIARFEAERQSLARMEHPGIARVIDAGATATGRPYFVMELVRGLPITEHCRRFGLDIRGRLELFLEVCAAVQHAHAKGVIHRDLKPSNVLIDASDGVARPKVIDFGIAKAVGEDDPTASLRTLTGQLVGTPAYMSPEQASGGVETLDTRSDVYALGVMVYELLAGSPPFDAESLKYRTPAEVCRVIREQEPPRPSTRLVALRGRDPASQSTPASLHIAEDLDWIVLKALEKDRERRYPSPAALADDLGRFLRHEPVEASPPSTWYRFRKLVRRHRGVSIAVGFTALALVLGIIGTGIGLVRAENALQIAEDEREVAVAERDRANAVTEFFRDVIAEANPEKHKGVAPSLVEVLTRAAADLDEDSSLSDQPDTAALLRMTIGRTFADLGQLEAAEQQFVKAYEMWGELHGPHHKDTVWALERLAENHWDRGQLVEAERLSRLALPAIAALHGADGMTYASASNDLGNILADMGRLDEAYELLKASYDTTVRLQGEETRGALQSLNNLGAILADLGRFADAVDVHRRSVELRRRVFGDPSRELGIATSNLGYAMTRLGRDSDDAELVEQGVRQFEESLRIKREVFGETHQDIGYTLVSLSAVERTRHRYDAALRHADQALECFAASGVTGWRVALAHSCRSLALLRQNDIESGLDAGEVAWLGFVDSLGTDNERGRKHARSMADCLRELDREADAARWEARATGG